MQIIYITGLILAEVPFILVGPDQSGKTTMLNAAIKILAGLVEKENHIITANIEYKQFIDRILQRVRLDCNGELWSPRQELQIFHMSVVTNGEDVDPNFGQMNYFIGQNLAVLNASGYAPLQIDQYKNVTYFGTSQL